MDELEWRVRWENDLNAAEHTALSALLARIYPAHGATFTDGRTWSGAIPELRVVGYDNGHPVAHAGVLRRFLRAAGSGEHLLVGDVGLVGVDPDCQGRGLGRELLARIQAAMRELELPFGFLTCRPEVVPFYADGGWLLLDGQITRMIDNALVAETYSGPAMMLPVTSPARDWPAEPLDRNGLEV